MKILFQQSNSYNFFDMRHCYYSGKEVSLCPGEIATAILHSSKSNLFTFFSTYGIQICVKHQDKIIGKTKH